MAELKETKASLERMQSFDVAKLPRRSELGQAFHFEEVVHAANRLVELYQRLTLTALDDLPESALTVVQNQGNSDFKIFEQVLQFGIDFGPLAVVIGFAALQLENQCGMLQTPVDGVVVRKID